MGREAGLKAENYFHALMNNKGIPVIFRDDWYDFEIYEGVKVEVKSCQLTIKDCAAKENAWRIGRFDFTKEENREQQYKENIWVCLIVRHREQFILYGFVKARAINKERYLSLHQARELKPLEFDEWLQRVEYERQKGAA